MTKKLKLPNRDSSLKSVERRESLDLLPSFAEVEEERASEDEMFPPPWIGGRGGSIPIQFTQGNKSTSHSIDRDGGGDPLDSVLKLTKQEQREELERQQQQMIRDLEVAGCYSEARKLRECGTRAFVFQHKESGKIKGFLKSCDSRCCVYCARARVARVREKYGDLIWEMEHPEFLTFTQRDIAGENLKAARVRLMESYQRLRRSYWWRESVEGGLYAVEMTERWDGEKQCWHVHIHCILSMRTDWIALFCHEKGEKEESYLPRLQAHQKECDAILLEIRSLARRVGKTRDPVKKQALAEQLRLCREKYLQTQTLTGLWYRATKSVVEKSKIEVEGAYVIWFEPLRRDSIAEVVKYSCKPMCLSRRGLAEAVDLLSGTHCRMLEAFGCLRDLVSEMEEEVPEESKYTFLGTAESLCRSADKMARTGLDRDEAIAQGSIVVKVLEEGLESVKKLQWEKQAIRILKIAVWWPSWLWNGSGMERIENEMERIAKREEAKANRAKAALTT